MEKDALQAAARARALVVTTGVKSIRQVEDILKKEGFTDWKIVDRGLRRELIYQMRTRAPNRREPERLERLADRIESSAEDKEEKEKARLKQAAAITRSFREDT